MAELNGLLAWYFEIPFISRCYLTAAVAVTCACFLDVVSPLTLYYNYELAMNKRQYWRFFSSFLFFGTFSLDFVFHMYFVMRYSRLLEEGHFRGRTADFLYMILLGALSMLLLTATVDTFSRIKFLGHPLSFMMVYLWSRDPENVHVRLSFFVLQFNAPILPWVMLSFSALLGNPIETDLLGIVVGHVYYFLDQVYPQVAEVRGWRWQKVLYTPPFLHVLFSSDQFFALLNTRVCFYDRCYSSCVLLILLCCCRW